MPTQAEISSLPEDYRDSWRLLGAGFQGAIHTQIERERRNGQPLALHTLLSLWATQTRPGELVARCAGTGVRFTPTGLAAPRVFRLDDERGMDPANLVLVCQAYWRLRIMARTFGHQGHEKVLAWAKEFVANGHDVVRTEGYPEELLTGEELDGLPLDE